MAPDAPRYSLTELADLAGVTPRTVRYYMSQGLLPSSGSSGPGAKYDDSHLERLRLVRKLQREHLPLAEIRQRLAGLDDAAIATLAKAPPAVADPQDSALDYIRRVLGPQPRPVTPKRLMAGLEPPPGYTLAREPRNAESMPAAPLARSPITLGVEPAPGRNFERSQWERIPLAPDVELHVRRPLPRPLAKQVDRLVSIARDLLEEDPS
jgi:DNA-binding transcriptional MerR regulator